MGRRPLGIKAPVARLTANLWEAEGGTRLLTREPERGTPQGVERAKDPSLGFDSCLPPAGCLTPGAVCPLWASVSHLRGLVMTTPDSTVPGTQEGHKECLSPQVLCLSSDASSELQDSLQCQTFWACRSPGGTH